MLMVLLNGELEVVLEGYDINNPERVKVLFEDTAREWWVDVFRLTRHQPDAAITADGSGSELDAAPLNFGR